MDNLKRHSLLLVGDIEDKLYFSKFFEEVSLVKNNHEAIEQYDKISPSIILLYCNNQENSLKIIEKIRQKNKNTIIIISTEEITTEILLEVLPLNVFGFLQRPFNTVKVHELLLKIEQQLSLETENLIFLKENYTYNIKTELLYDNQNQEIKLTKHEVEIINLFISKKNNFITTNVIEHSLWADESQEIDCNKRLKTLLYVLKKKLPKNSIVNSYGLGYKLVCHL